MSAETKSEAFREELWMWGQEDQKPRFLHTMIRVKDFDAALDFYIDGLGMKLLCEPFDVPSRRVTACFIGFDSLEAGGCVEIVHLWDHEGDFTHGDGYGHFSVGAPDIEGTLARMVEKGAEVITPPTVLIEGGPAVAFFKDLDGYAVELIQTKR